MWPCCLCGSCVSLRTHTCKERASIFTTRPSAIISAAYTLASSLVAYVTFTTAVSVSVITVKQEKAREGEGDNKWKP